jgi:hypothetical protein
MDRKGFEQYVDDFNNMRYDKVTGHFAPDVTVEYFDDAWAPYAPARTLHGIKEFEASYRALHAHTREVMALEEFMTKGDLMFVALYTEFHTFKDAPAGAGPMRKKGDVILMTNWVLYNMTPDDKFKRIRIAHFRDFDPRTARFKHLVPKS